MSTSAQTARSIGEAESIKPGMLWPKLRCYAQPVPASPRNEAGPAAGASSG